MLYLSCSQSSNASVESQLKKPLGSALAEVVDIWILVIYIPASVRLLSESFGTTTPTVAW